MKILHLTLKKKWFDMIASGEKTEEYREIKPHWIKRIGDNVFDAVEFRNGYVKNSPKILVELKNMRICLGRVEWGAPENEPVYVLELGDILERSDGK